jgi:hypothetical protein
MWIHLTNKIKESQESYKQVIQHSTEYYSPSHIYLGTHYASADGGTK